MKDENPFVMLSKSHKKIKNRPEAISAEFRSPRAKKVAKKTIKALDSKP